MGANASEIMNTVLEARFLSRILTAGTRHGGWEAVSGLKVKGSITHTTEETAY